MRSEGRPNLYTDEQLLNVLKDYQKNHPNQKIKYVQLEKATGIKVHIWKYQMRDWALLLEENGIIGEGLSFTEEEIRKAEQTPIINNYTNNFYASVEDIDLQQGNS